MRQTLDLGTGRVEFEGGPDTRVFLLLGHPVSHSASPRLHEAALRAAGIDAVYRTFDVEPGDFRTAMGAIRPAALAGRVAGVNVTVPHKLAVLAEAGELDPISALAGAVNTIVVKGSGAGRALLGANTDVGGLRAALADLGASLSGQRLLILGTGGMARAAVAAALTDGAAEIRVAGRDLDKAREMLDDVAHRWQERMPHLACVPFESAAASLQRTEVLVQATSLGLAPSDPLPVSVDAVPASLVILDAVYATGGTPLVRAARARGLRAADGHGLLVHQGAAAFALWTGLPPPVDIMRRAL